MNHKKIFKEVEASIVEVSGRPFISIDDLNRIYYDLCFTKSDMDIHTLLTIRRLNASMALTYKALKEGGLLDVNEDLAIISLSKRKVKKLVKKSLALSKKNQDVGISNLDHLEDYLADDEPSLSISKEETEELIKESIGSCLEPYGEVWSDIKKIIEEQAKVKQEPVKQAKIKPKSKPSESTEETPEDEELKDVDFAALEGNKK